MPNRETAGYQNHCDTVEYDYITNQSMPLSVSHTYRAAPDYQINH